ncbi:hypothetical protein MGG_16021 [Pyricularia oryzae 70-15]|uniref:Uncharacterized protein n=1 Tax=Pyricularia oryzae (strain 70-15 / ATCC MYA-4617 / FGSC 8958) TaxID=242507 RepID=G4MN77_PYRO7|nr:uncharacterized protein MGG_16021 [Pyricularia oryzae 70-15]EHA56200.1 hypothetical protein MGG_16021 [Pyricularia oryzae 70-15]
MEDMGTRFLQDRVRAAKAKADALKAELLQAEHESAHLASEIEKAERRAFLEEEKNERETQTRNSIRKFLQEAKLPQKLPPRSFRREANRIAEYWENHGLESGLTFTSLMCLCQALPKTDWSLLEKYPDTFQELSSMVNRRFQFSWEMWAWYCKFLDPARVESCAFGAVYDAFKHDVPGLCAKLQRLHSKGLIGTEIYEPPSSSTHLAFPGATGADDGTLDCRPKLNQGLKRKELGSGGPLRSLVCGNQIVSCDEPQSDQKKFTEAAADGGRQATRLQQSPCKRTAPQPQRHTLAHFPGKP